MKFATSVLVLMTCVIFLALWGSGSMLHTVLDLAVTKGNCASIPSDLQDECYLKKSVNARGADVRLADCLRITDEDLIDSCLLLGAESAMSTDVLITFCDKMRTESANAKCDNLYRTLRLKECGDGATEESCPLLGCDEVSNTQTCYRRHAHDFEDCNIVDQRDLCYLSVAFNTIDIRGCDKIEDDQMQSTCFEQVLSTVDGVNTCLGLSELSSKRACLTEVLNRSGPWDVENNERYVNLLAPE